MTKGSLEIQLSQASGFSSTDGRVLARAKEAFEQLGVLLTEAVAPLREKLARATASADEIELKLDLSLEAEGKWVVVSMGGTATLSVKLVWKNAK